MCSIKLMKRKMTWKTGVLLFIAVLVLAAKVQGEYVCIENDQTHSYCDSNSETIIHDCAECSDQREQGGCEDTGCKWETGDCTDVCAKETNETSCYGITGCSFITGRCTDICLNLDTPTCDAEVGCVSTSCEKYALCDEYLIETCPEGCTFIGMSCTDVCEVHAKDDCNDDCIWDGTKCTHSCLINDTTACNSDPLCKIVEEQDICHATGGICSSYAQGDCLSDIGCGWESLNESYCTSGADCDIDNVMCEGTEGCWLSGDCVTSDGNCTDQTSDESCCANACAWVECQEVETDGVSRVMGSLVVVTASLAFTFGR